MCRELGMRQSIYAPIFENPDQATFIEEIKAKIIQFIPSTWYGMLITILSSVMGQDIYDVGQIIKPLLKRQKYW